MHSPAQQSMAWAGSKETGEDGLTMKAPPLTVEHHSACCDCPPWQVAVGWEAGVASDWWSRFVFGKTFVERRSLLTVFRWLLGWLARGRAACSCAAAKLRFLQAVRTCRKPHAAG